MLQMTVENPGHRISQADGFGYDYSVRCFCICQCILSIYMTTEHPQD